jgi:ethanolamine ammonia-lyase small subunit
MTEWPTLRRHTQARIGLRRAGAALSTPELLEFRLAHARARDAVFCRWDVAAFEAGLNEAGVASLRVKTCATDRTIYLKRPDLGRRLEPNSLPLLAAGRSEPAPDIALIVSDGLSATALHAHGVATVLAARAALERRGMRCSPVVLVEHGRVAVSDEIGHALGARAAVIVLGERPGLSAADSLGFYLTYGPRPGNSDAQRNCISNVRQPNGLAPELAAARLANLLQRALASGVSGVLLKDEGEAMLGEG